MSKTQQQEESSMSGAKQALLEIRRLRHELDAHKQAASSPVAIVGCGMRFPGQVNSPKAYWEFLLSATSAIGEVPSERWDVDRYFDENRDAKGSMYTKSGGFIDDIDQFDASFFGISPREADSMDPQQRLLLTTSIEALEDAGINSAQLRGSRTGVFFALCNSDYSRLIFSDPTTPDVSAATGNQSSVAAGRVSYTLGLQGPCLVVDTACSSSLVALHLAVASLRRGECDTALVGGANLILTPEMHINFCQAQMLSPDGRCKTFDDSADGYGRGEGCGVIVLKRETDAKSNKDRIYASVRGTASNQDGQSAGLTAPNGLAQEAVIAAALKNAGLRATDVDYVEAHGTGTPLGDPIEARALGAALGNRRDANSPLLIGSAKTNFGHLEAAAGIAGVIKTALSIYHAKLPKHLNFAKANNEISLNELNLEVVTEARDWPQASQRVAGVSSFGFGGTNAHVILASADSQVVPAAVAGEQLLVLSARSEQSLKAQARRFSAVLDAGQQEFSHLARSSVSRRSHYEHRLVVVCPNPTDASAALQQFADGKPGIARYNSIVEGQESPRISFWYAGQGTQYEGMGFGLYTEFDVYKQALDKVTALFDQHFGDGPSLLGLMHGTDKRASVNDAHYAQAAIFSLAYALTELWSSFGVEPELVAGHSLGEYLAALNAGVMSIDDAVTLVATRSRLVHGLSTSGAMRVALCDHGQVSQLLTRHKLALDIAAINGPANTVVSGPTDVIEAFEKAADNEGIEFRVLKVPNAFHSAMLEPILDEFEAVARRIEFRPPVRGLLSNLDGQSVDSKRVLDATYWRRHLREPVRFMEALRTFNDGTPGILLELGAHPTLVPMCDGQLAPEVTASVSLRRGEDDRGSLLHALGALYLRGADLAWDRCFGSEPPADLPTYAFQTDRHWIESGSPRSSDGDGQSIWEFTSKAGSIAASRAPLALHAASLEATWATLRELSKRYIINALVRLDVLTKPCHGVSLSELIEPGPIRATYRHLLQRWLRLLNDEQIVVYDDQAGTIDCASGLASVDVDDALIAAREAYRDELFLVDYIARCGEMLADVVSGKTAALETLFPGGSSEVAEKLYTEYSVSAYVSGIAAASVAALAASHTREVRVLEIGAGTGGTTAAILPALPPGRVHYSFTDISDYFLGQAARRFSDYDNLNYSLLDIGNDTTAQGFAAHSVDAIVATNVLHATPDLRETLKNVLGLLRSDGVLVLSEVTRELDWYDISTGLIEGWQSFDDDIRGDSPLLPAEVWKEVLLEAGFTEVIALPDAASDAAAVGQNVILARAPGHENDSMQLQRAQSGRVEEQATVGAGILAELSDAPASEQREMLVDHVLDVVSAILRLPASARPAATAGLFDLGLDSLMALDFRRQLQASLALDEELPATLIFDCPNAEAIGEFLAAECLDLGANDAGVIGEPTDTPATNTVSDADIEEMSDEDIEALLLNRLDAGNEKN